MKSVIIEHLKTSHKLSKAMRQAENVSQVYDTGRNSDSETKRQEIFFRCKNTKSQAYKGNASTCNVETLNSVNLQL